MPSLGRGAWAALVLTVVHAAAPASAPASAAAGLTLTRFNNTACAGTGSQTVLDSLESFADCLGSSCGSPSSLLLTGRVAPPAAGNYGFHIVFDPPLPYPSDEAYAYLWVHDHLLYPNNTGLAMGSRRAGGGAPRWIPLPPRALDLDLSTIEHDGAAALSSYEVRLQYVCRAATGCGGRKISLRWATFADVSAPSTLAPTALLGPPAPPPPPPFTPIPASVLRPEQSGPEIQRRELYARLQQGWQTAYHPGMLTWVLLPESFAVKVGLYRLSSGAFLSPEGLTVNPTLFHQFVVRAGLHSYDNSYIEASVTWRSGVNGTGGGNVNVSIATTVDTTDSSQMTMTASVNNADQVNASDFLLLLIPNFTHGRAGSVSADSKGVSGVSAGLRKSTLSLIQGAATPVPPPPPPMAVTNAVAVGSSPPQVPATVLGVSLATTVVLSTDGTMTAAAVATKTAAYRAKEAATLDGWGEWGEVKDAMQTSLAWSFMFDPKEGLVAPVTRNWGFGAANQVDGDQTEGLFCWDGSFASYMLSLDALDLSFSNLIQIIKMRTSAGFIPSYSAGTLKSRDRTNPPVTANILHQITQRWGAAKTQWVVELCFDVSCTRTHTRTRTHLLSSSLILHFHVVALQVRLMDRTLPISYPYRPQDLLNWNTWMYIRRREAPLGLLSWGSDPYPYAPDGTGSDVRGTGGGGANLESGLDNGPVMDGVPFNQTGLYLQDEYDVGYTGMFLMDCKAQIALAKMIGRDDAVTTLQSRFDTVNKAMLANLWNSSAGYFQNRLSKDLSPVERMAPTHFYPMLAGPEAGPSADQVKATITRHLVNPARFAVWPTGDPPTDHPIPPAEARPLVQWESKTCGHGPALAASAAADGPMAVAPPVGNCTHTLCCQLSCNFVQRVGVKTRYEGMGIASLPETGSADAGANMLHELIPLFDYACGANGTDLTMGPKDWKPAQGGPCEIAKKTDSHTKDFPAEASMYVYETRGTGPSAADLVSLDLYYKHGDHYLVATDAGKADAAANGYSKVTSLGYVWPAPGTENATSRYGLPSISKDDKAYIDQNYWHGRTWSPMIQLVYWGLELYADTVPEAKGAIDGLVAQSKALLLKEWRGYGNQSAPGGSYAGSGRYVYENFGADTGEGYGYSSEAQPMYSWGALAGFIGMQRDGFMKPHNASQH
jgi:hypothetical protein